MKSSLPASAPFSGPVTPAAAVRGSWTLPRGGRGLSATHARHFTYSGPRGEPIKFPNTFQRGGRGGCLSPIRCAYVSAIAEHPGRVELGCAAPQPAIEPEHQIARLGVRDPIRVHALPVHAVPVEPPDPGAEQWQRDTPDHLLSHPRQVYVVAVRVSAVCGMSDAFRYGGA
jgi:hypothetical protein